MRRFAFVLGAALPLVGAAPGAWAEDVVILEGIGSGQQAHRIARALPGRRAPEIVARFRALVPVRTPDAIERALSAARTR